MEPSGKEIAGTERKVFSATVLPIPLLHLETRTKAKMTRHSRKLPIPFTLNATLPEQSYSCGKVDSKMAMWTLLETDLGKVLRTVRGISKIGYNSVSQSGIRFNVCSSSGNA